MDGSDFIAALYSDWIPRLTSADQPLSPVERTGYLVVDCLVSLETGSIDRLVDDQDTVNALMAVGLDHHARKLQGLISTLDEEEQAEALNEWAYAFDERDEFEAAVARFIRGHAS